MRHLIAALIFILINTAVADTNTGCPDPKDQSQNDLLMKALNGDVFSRIEIAEKCVVGENKDYERALAWLRPAAESGHPIALNKLGTFYQFGRGTEKNVEEAIKLYERAAVMGLPVAQYNIGWIYYYGYGGAGIDIPKAFMWLGLAAWAGEVKAQSYLAQLYANGRANVPKSPKLAYVWATIAEKSSKDKILTEQLTKLKKRLLKDLSQDELTDALAATSDILEQMQALAKIRLHMVSEGQD